MEGHTKQVKAKEETLLPRFDSAFSFTFESWASVANCILEFGVYVHHMFTRDERIGHCILGEGEIITHQLLFNDLIHDDSEGALKADVIADIAHKSGNSDLSFKVGDDCGDIFFKVDLFGFGEFAFFRETDSKRSALAFKIRSLEYCTTVSMGKLLVISKE